LRLTITFAILLTVFAGYAPGDTLKIANVNGNIYESEKVVQELEFEGPGKLIFNTDGGFSGHVNIGTYTESPKLQYVEHFKARSMEEAQEFAKYIKFQIDKIGDTTTVQITTNRRAPWMGTDQSARVEIEISIPELAEVEINSKSFDIMVTGPFGNVDIDNEFGRVRVSKATNGLRLATENSFVRISDISGRVDASTSNAKLRAERINTLGEKARFRNEYGIIDISNFTGILDCETSYGPLDLKEIHLIPGSSRFSTVYSEIDAEIVAMDSVDLFVEDNFSNISLVLPQDAETTFSVEIDRGGKIQLTGIPVIPESLARDRLMATTQNPTSAIEIELIGIGTVNLTGQRFRRTP